MNNRKLPEGEVSICGKWQGTRAVPAHGTWLGRGQSCGSGDLVCGPALITAAETAARGPGFYSTWVRCSVQLSAINRLSVWSVEALRTPGKDTWIMKWKRNNLKLQTNSGEKDKEKIPKLQLFYATWCQSTVKSRRPSTFRLAHAAHRPSFTHLSGPGSAFLEVMMVLEVTVNAGLGYMFCPSQSRDGLKPTQAARVGSILNRGHWIWLSGGQKSQGHLSLPPTSCVTVGRCTHPSAAQWSDLKNGNINRAYVCVDCTAGYFKAGRFTWWRKFTPRFTWRRLFRVPWSTRRSNQSILKETNPEYSLEGLMLKLKLQYFGHLMWKVDSLAEIWCWERLKAGGERDDRGRDGWMASSTQRTWVWANSRRWWRTWKPFVLWSMGLQRVRHDWATERQQKGRWWSQVKSSN